VRLARLLLTLYPPAFRRDWGDAYLEAAEHRLRLERSRSPAAAPARAAWVLLADAARSVPGEWRAAIRGPGTRTNTNDVMGGGRVNGVEGWIWDVRIAVRSLVRRPTVSVLVVGTLALGIGANATIFGAVDRLVLSPLPFEGADRAALIMSHFRSGDFTFSITPEEYERYRQGSTSFERIESYQPADGLLAHGETLEQLDGLGVSVGLAGMIGAAPVLGRTFNIEDAAPDAPRVVMLSERYWRSSMGGDPDVIGSTVTISDVDRTVVGIWPDAGRFSVDNEPDFLTPLTRGQEIDRSYFSIALGLLAEGVDRDEAAAELAALRAGIEIEGADSSDREETPRVLPVHHFVAGSFIQALWILFAGVGLLLLVAGVNSANLLLNRAVDRGHELGVRMTLGGSRARLLRHFFLEGALLSGVGAAMGVGVAQLGTWWLARMAPPHLPTSALDTGVGGLTAYTLGLAAVLTMVCTIVPALHLRSSEVRTLVRSVGSASRRLQRLRGGLVAGQVALAAILVVGSGLAVRSLSRLQAINYGFAAQHMEIVTVRYPVGAYADLGERQAVATRIREELASLPAVADVSVSFVLPLAYSIRFGIPYLDGDQPTVVEEGAHSQSATSAEGFLATTGIPLLEGRDFTADERRDPSANRVVLVNRGFAARYPSSVVGRNLLFPNDTVGRLIVGVVGDVRTGNVTDRTVRPQIYYPSDGIGSTQRRTQRFLVRLAAGAVVPEAAIHERVRAVDPALRVQAVDVGAEMVAERSAPNRFLAVILSLLGALSLTLAVSGVYGAVRLYVARRTREMGIRTALGALPARVIRSVVLRGMIPVTVGLVVGLAFAAAAVGYISGILYEVSPWDPVSFITAVVALLGAAVLAAHVPARRAARVDPIQALRAE
jgi:putative ABC transport system permease protein